MRRGLRWIAGNWELLAIGFLLVASSFLVSFAQTKGTPTARGVATLSSNQVWVKWTNLPPAVLVQGSTNMTNWFTLLVVSSPDGGRLPWFEYPTDGRGTNFYRLVEILPVTNWVVR